LLKPGSNLKFNKGRYLISKQAGNQLVILLVYCNQYGSKAKNISD